METFTITARDLLPGMTIVDRTGRNARKTEVKRVEHSPVGCKNSTHVNRSVCYNTPADPVEVLV